MYRTNIASNLRQGLNAGEDLSASAFGGMQAAGKKWYDRLNRPVNALATLQLGALNAVANPKNRGKVSDLANIDTSNMSQEQALNTLLPLLIGLL